MNKPQGKNAKVKQMPKWFTIELCPSLLKPNEEEWVAHEGRLPATSRQLSRRRSFTVQIQTMNRDQAIMDARRIHGAKKLQTNLRKGKE